MPISFGAKIFDAAGKAIGTFYLALHPDTREIDRLVVHQGVLKGCEALADDQGSQGGPGAAPGLEGRGPRESADIPPEPL
jgi:hypothetical protein